MSTTYLPEVPISKIKPHPKNPRLQLTEIDELAASITQVGLLEHLVLAPPLGSSAAYTLVAGHRRLAAAKQAGLKTVPATLREDLDSPEKQLAAILSENTQRVDLSPIEEADAFTQLVAFPGMTQAKAAKATGRSATFVKQRLALAKLPDGARKKVHGGEITLEQATTIMSFVGTPEYTKVVNAAGTTNFGYAVENAKREQKAREQLQVVKDHAERLGWLVTESYSDCGSEVLGPWKLKGTLQKALDSLEGPHVLRISYGRWSICSPPTLEDRERDHGYQPTPEEAAQRDAERAAREQHAEALDVARKVRRDWLTTNAWHQRIGKDERLAVLRLLVESALEVGNWEESDLALSLVGPLPDDGTDGEEYDAFLQDWTATADEPQLWRLLCVLSLALDSNSSWTTGIEWQIRFATALGYQPSDVELALITPEVKA